MLRHIRFFYPLFMKYFLLLIFFVLIPLSGKELRVVSLTPALTETVCFLGKEQLLAGRSSACDYPESVKKLPPAGDFAGFYLEQLIRLQPDLIIANDLTPKSERQKRHLTSKVAVIPVKTVEDYIQALLRLGELLDCKEKAELEAENARQNVRKLKQDAAKKEKKSALWIIWHNPVMIAGPGSFPNTVMELAGLQNLASSAPAEYFKCSREWLAMQKPDYLIWTVSGIPFESRGIWKEFPESMVISNLNHDILLRPGPRMFDGIRHLQEAIERRQNPL